MLQRADCLFIGGEWVRPSSLTEIEVINSGTEEVFARVAEAQTADVNRAVEAARTAFDHGPWPRMTHAERAAFLREIAAECNTRAADIARIWTLESGIIHSISSPSAAALGTVFGWSADMAETFPFIEKRTPLGGGLGLLIREPVGVVAAIIPWNGPAIMAAFKCAPALLAGCTIVIKASPEAPGTIYVLAEIFDKVGLPKGVINILTANRAVSEDLVRHPGVDKVSFTGSTAAGRRVASICGDRIARVTLELGGKSPALVLDDFDIETAAKTLCAQEIPVTGQVCSSLTRVIVSRHRHDQLVEALSEIFRVVRVGDPFESATEMGPLAMSRQRDRVEAYVAKGIAEGATLATGGRRPAHMSRGYYIEPTVFGNVSNDQLIAREEIFGPVLSVIPVKNEREAVSVANQSIYGLNATVFTNDADRAYSVARELRSGTVGHNSFRSDFSIAVGGFKQSGIGREGGTEGLLSYLETKTIVLDASPSNLERPLEEAGSCR